MMKYLLMMLMVITAAQVTASGVYDIIESLAERAEQATTTSAVEVVELFQAQSPEELEAALTNGYPMPWLEEILNDESIPEEDRYWLDCRVRAVIAQDLHLFYDRDGNTIHVEADWIMYGESYWQEHFIVNPPGEYPRGEINPVTGLWGETGFVYNRFGEQTGELALCEEGMYLSRDGSVGLLVHRGTEHITEYGPVCLYFVYDDGTYYKNPEELWTYDYTLSQSGNYALLVQRVENEPDPVQMFDREGSILWEQEADGRTVTNTEPVILPGDEVCVIPSVMQNPITHYSQLFAVNTGAELYELSEVNTRYSYSSNGNYLCIGNACYSASTYNMLWNMTEYLGDNQGIYKLNCSNEMERFSVLLRTRIDDQTVIADFVVIGEDGRWLLKEESNQGQSILLSPNGTIALAHPISTHSWKSPTPCNIWLIGGER